jgi:sulfide:quinone oxidoreductase
MPANTLVLGCGLGGLATASLLSKQLGTRGTVTVVEPRAKIPLPSSLPWIAFAWREPNKIQKDLKKLGKRKNVRIIPEKVEKINVNGRSVKTESQELSYDKLVVSLGAELALDEVPDLDSYSHMFYTLDGAIKLRDAIENFPGGTIVVGICRTPFKCPAAPYELALLLEEHMRRAKKKIEIQFFTPEPHPVPAAGSVIGKQVERLLSSRGIKYLPKTKPSKIEKDRVVFENGSALSYDLLVTVPPHRPPKVVVEAGLAEASGWVPVNPQNLATKFEDVYAIGDVTSVETPHGHVPFLPKAGVFALGQAEIVANNIAVSVNGKGQLRQWDGRGACHLQVTKSESAFLQGSFLSNPPRLEFHPPSRKWYRDKVKREKDWLA